ncbi:MAG: hypothetical protein ACTS84_02040 [Arsenophonus sp. NC-LC2-MAG3]
MTNGKLMTLDKTVLMGITEQVFLADEFITYIELWIIHASLTSWDKRKYN